MFSLEVIIHLNNEAAREARRKKKEPHVPTPEEIENFPPFPLPHLGPFVPPGWEQVEDAVWFADSSGWGRNDEPALSVGQLKEVLREFATEIPATASASSRRVSSSATSPLIVQLRLGRKLHELHHRRQGNARRIR
jgi:hypothetical protein